MATIDSKALALVADMRAVAAGPCAEQNPDLAMRIAGWADALAAVTALPTREQHRCSGCGHRWEGGLKGAELCGDCWRKGQAAILSGGGPSGSLQALIDPEPVGWYCGCGWPNGINLATCAQCGRRPQPPENLCAIIYRKEALAALPGVPGVHRE